MADTTLFREFESVSSKQWKQQIQYELKGADYNETLVWESPEGIKTKPFYHIDEFESTTHFNASKHPFNIVQRIFVHDVKKSNQRAAESLNRGAESIYFTIENEMVSLDELMLNLPVTPTYYFKLPFLSKGYVEKISAFATQNHYRCIVLSDPIGQLVTDGNWFSNLETDFENLQQLNANAAIPFVSVNSEIYHNAGATITQQLAYTLAHASEYFNRIPHLKSPITLEIAVGSNYFFEIAKIRALRLLFKKLAHEFHHEFDCHIIATPGKRNKTLYDYNVNMLRTTTECMSAVLGGADAVSNLPYDALYHKDNEFGDRIARNQLLILKHESYFDKVQNPAEGSYYIESLSYQLAEKALAIFKDIETGGGLITQLIEGTIQRKVAEAAQKEQEAFNNGQEVLLGTNKYPNKNDRMKDSLELYPFVKQNPRKTLIAPLIERRLAEQKEQERLAEE